MAEETDEAFVERLRKQSESWPQLTYIEADRLFALARRGAAVRWRPISEVPPHEVPLLLWPGNYDMPETARLKTDDGLFWGGDWDYLIRATHFIPLTALGEPE